MLDFFFLRLINSSQNYFWDKIWPCNFNKWMLVSEAVFTDLAIIKVMTYRAFVSNTKNRTCSASIASNVLMSV